MNYRLKINSVVASTIVAICLSLNGYTVAQQPESVAHILPDTTAIYVELADPAGLIDNINNHPVLKQVEEMDEAI